MNNKLKNLSEVVAKANDSFTEQHADTNTLMGIMDKSLRKQGLPADAITIDCVAVDKKLCATLLVELQLAYSSMQNSPRY